VSSSPPTSGVFNWTMNEFGIISIGSVTSNSETGTSPEILEPAREFSRIDCIVLELISVLFDNSPGTDIEYTGLANIAPSEMYVVKRNPNKIRVINLSVCLNSSKLRLSLVFILPHQRKLIVGN
jgi:hypothetical protein